MKLYYYLSILQFIYLYKWTPVQSLKETMLLLCPCFTVTCFDRTGLPIRNKGILPYPGTSFLISLFMSTGALVIALFVYWYIIFIFIPLLLHNSYLHLHLYFLVTFALK